MNFIREHRLFVLLVALPAAPGLVIALSLQHFSLSNPLLVWRFTLDLGTLVFIVSLIISTLGALAAAGVRYWTSRLEKSVAAERERRLQAHQQFLKRLDHELKNPIVILQTSLANLEASPRKAQEQVRIAQEQVARLSHLGRSLRKLSSLADYPLELSTLDIPELTAQVIADIEEETGADKSIIRLNVQQVPWSPRPVVGDRDLLYLALRNLIENAVKFTHSNSLIEVDISERQKELLVEIADNGPGIAGRDLPHLFRPLYRGTNARGVAGSGLGLALVKAALDRHQGQIEVQSRVGQGTVFTVRLPLRQAP